MLVLSPAFSVTVKFKKKGGGNYNEVSVYLAPTKTSKQ